MASTHKDPGTLVGIDLTVEDARKLSSFYADVIGWIPQEEDMGGYRDFGMLAPSSGAWVAGICHSRGMNADLPPQWMIYVAVEDLEAALSRCTASGGRALTSIKGTKGEGRYCVISDPAGAVLALAEQPD
jgi:predicted enzyme related to lactoylglutathione lyase